MRSVIISEKVYFVLKCLAGEAKDKDGEVTMLGLYKYANKETKLYVAHRYNEVQTPELFGKGQGDVAIGPVGGGTGGALPPAIVTAAHETDEEYAFCMKKATEMPAKDVPAYRSNWLRKTHAERKKEMEKDK